MNTLLENNPIRHTQTIKAKLHQIISHLQNDVGTVTEAKAQELFEASADVLGALVEAYDDYEKSGKRLSRTELMASLPKRRIAHASRR
jgi:hypothetical protein